MALLVIAGLGIWAYASTRPWTPAVARRDILASLPLRGKVVAPPVARADVMAPYRAPVARVYASVGDRVRRGDVLVELSHPTAQAAYEQARAELIDAGIPADAIAVLQGETGATVIADTRRSAHSWLDLGDERRYVERVEDGAPQGHYVIGVPLPNGSDATRRFVKSILAAHGGHAIVSGSRWMHEVVD